MLNEQQVKYSLKEVKIPSTSQDVSSMIKEIAISGNDITVRLYTPEADEMSKEFVKNKTINTLKKLDSEVNVTVEYVEGKPGITNTIGNVIAIMSGKGGVGKSLVSGLTAVALRRMGYKVGILDADITGPSIPKMFGVTERPGGNDKGINPVETKTGIKIMSINLLLPNEEDAVIWRGPLIARAITQFWEEVYWGELDYLVVDLPPGTADAPLTVLQTIPVSGIIIVFTPQDLTAMIVKKAVKMAQQMQKPILGIVENMSYLYVEEIDKKIELFGKSQADAMAKAAGAPLLGRIPIDPALAKLIDAGSIENYDIDIIGTIGESIKKSTGR
jgi:hydrogenase maturation protease